MDEPMDRDWQQLSEEVLSGLKEWRLAHPKATMHEIEQAVEERMNRLRARLLEDVALASEAREWKQESQQERPRCSVCQTPLQARGKHSRRLQTTGGLDITLSRSYGTCPHCGTGLFPPG